MVYLIGVFIFCRYIRLGEPEFINVTEDTNLLLTACKARGHSCGLNPKNYHRAKGWADDINLSLLIPMRCVTSTNSTMTLGVFDDAYDEQDEAKNAVNTPLLPCNDVDLVRFQSRLHQDSLRNG